MKKFISIAILACLLGYVFWHMYTNRDRDIGVEVRNIAPDFTLEQYNGDQITLSELKGKKVIINFWASWCKPCKKEMPEFEKLQEKYQEDVVVLAVNYTVTEPSENAVYDFLEENPYKLRILLDPKNDVSSGYNVLTLPTTFFLNSDGIIEERYVGEMNQELMEEYYRKLE